jgi:hypothetical protein
VSKKKKNPFATMKTSGAYKKTESVNLQESQTDFLIAARTAGGGFDILDTGYQTMEKAKKVTNAADEVILQREVTTTIHTPWNDEVSW